MVYDPEKHHRRSIRLKEYDYSQSGSYFITICTYKKELLFGEVIDGQMQLNEYGEIVKNEWLHTAIIRTNVMSDIFVVMPNHIHGILVLESNVGATRWVAPTILSGSIGAIIGQFKSIATKRINKVRNIKFVPVWQRNYYEHIIRNEGNLNEIREYIINNPLKWESDRENPQNQIS